MKIRAVLSTATVAVVALSAAACGGGDGGAKAADSNGLVEVDFSVLPIAQAAMMVVAEEQGIFEKHGIDLTVSPVEPAVLVPTLMSGDTDFIWNNPTGLLAARQNNVPIKSVTTISTAGEDPDAFPIQVMVPSGSDIKSIDDLGGKTVGTGLLFQVPDIAVRGALDRDGVDTSTVEFVEVPFQNQAESLAAGRVDAAIATEPFVTIMKDSGEAAPVGSALEGMPATTPVSNIVATDKFIAENPDLVEDFRAAIDEASEYALAHEDEVRAAIPEVTELSPELAKVIALAPISTVDDPEGWDMWADLLVETGVLEEKPDSADAFLAD